VQETGGTPLQQIYPLLASGYRSSSSLSSVTMLNSVQRTGAIRVVGEGRQGVAEIANVTTDIAEALDGAELIFVVVPSYALKRAAKVMAPHLRGEQRLLLTPGGTCGALEFARTLLDCGSEPPPIGETSTLPWAARREGDAVVRIHLCVKTLFFACFPARYGMQFCKEFGRVYPAATLMTDVMETALNNGNPITHPVPTLLNAARLEAGVACLFYREGITPAVARINERLDRERLAICRRMGYREIPAHRRLALMGYAPERPTLYESYRDSEAFASIKAPEGLEDRYITEDVPYGLVTLASIGELCGVPMPVTDAAITLLEYLVDRDFRRSGRTVETLGIGGMSLDELREFLQEGY